MTFKFTFPFCREVLVLGSSVSEGMEHGTQADWDQALSVAHTSCVSPPAQVGLETGRARSLRIVRGTTVPAGSEIAPAPGREINALTPDEAQDSPQGSNGANPGFSRGHTYWPQLQTREQKHISKRETWGRGVKAGQPDAERAFQELPFQGSPCSCCPSATCCLELCALGHFSSQASISPSVQLGIRRTTPSLTNHVPISSFLIAPQLFSCSRSCWNSELNAQVSERWLQIWAKSGPQVSFVWPAQFKVWFKCQHP